MEKLRYPQVEIDLKKLYHNARQIVLRCEEQGIEVAGVIKGCSGIPRCTEQFSAAGCKWIASSRLEQIEAAIGSGIQTPMMLIRVPMLSEAEDVVRLTDVSLNSDIAVLKALNREAGRQDKKHQVILMADLGDLREGFWDRDELVSAALLVEYELQNLKLAGVGTNLGCYGAVAATAEKLSELVDLAERIEERIGRELQYISGGATTSLTRLLKGDMPARINQLRIGEAILLAKDLSDIWDCDTSFLYRDVFTLKAEVVEVREKPSYPSGEIEADAFGQRPQFVDRGVRRRAVLALGKVDYAFPDALIPRDAGVEVIGASSDHTILDIEAAAKSYKAGDILEFDLRYAGIAYATGSANVRRVFVEG